MRLPVLRLTAVEITFFLVMLEELPLLLRLCSHIRRQPLEMGNQGLMVGACTGALNHFTNSRAIDGLVWAHGSARA